MVFYGGKAGTYTICLDNLRPRHSDGSTMSIWSSAKATRTSKFNATELFKELEVRTIDAAEVGK